MWVVERERPRADDVLGGLGTARSSSVGGGGATAGLELKWAEVGLMAPQLGNLLPSTVFLMD